MYTFKYPDTILPAETNENNNQTNINDIDIF